MAIVIEPVSYDEALEMMGKEMYDHWDEVPFGDFNLELNLKHEIYRAAEAEGHARFYMAWDGANPVAYLSVFATEMSQHAGVLQATMDAYYVAPAYRKGGVFGKLLTFVEQDLSSYGVRFLTIGVNTNYKGKTSEFLLSQGYQVTEITHSKEL